MREKHCSGLVAHSDGRRAYELPPCGDNFAVRRVMNLWFPRHIASASSIPTEYRDPTVLKIHLSREDSLNKRHHTIGIEWPRDGKWRIEQSPPSSRILHLLPNALVARKLGAPQPQMDACFS
ncbi:predicted protein [Histoplasma capsulatum H143]|uniref:Uncharacterized protein n=1 Tax=Ajellomyces capsulatus (strain H143) TaxID=544712 RepID=C6HFL3_AJECH|nr:predicted protein [Histoplasma capsulatum H143]